MTTRPDRTVPREAILGVVLMVIGVLAYGGNLLIQGAVTRGVARQQSMTLSVERMLSDLASLEASQRGFLLTGRENFLGPYAATRAAIEGVLDTVGRLGLSLDGLPQQISERLRIADVGIAARRAGGLDGAAAFIETGGGVDAMSAARTSASALEGRAAARIRALDARAELSGWLLGLIAAAALLGGLGCFALFGLQRRREQRSSAALLDAVMKNAPIGLGLVDASMAIRHMNPALASLTTDPQAHRRAGNLWDAAPALRATLEPALRRAISEGEATQTMPFTASAADGTSRLLELGVYPLGVGAQRLNGAGIAIADVTERAGAQAQIRANEARFRTLIEASTAIVWATTPDGELVEPRGWCAFTGQTPSEAQGSGWLDAVHAADRDETFAVWRDAVAGRGVYEVEHRVRRHDGAWRTMAARGVPVLDEVGAVREWVGMHSDITERREAEHALIAARDAADAANRAKSTFLANMSHELRTPLTAVIGYSEMLEEEVEEMGEQHLLGDLRKIETNARHLLGLINDVLDLSKIEANRMTTFAETFNVAALLQDAAGTVGSLVAKKRNRLTLALGPSLGTMHSDLVKLRQCVFNLISNAAKFTEDGEITLAARREADGWLAFSVTDTGIGMTEDQIGRLFQRFSQADEGTTRQFGGTGLGLAITRAFCRLLGGDIVVASTQGVGTTFTIRVPATLPEMPAEAETAVDPSGEAPSADDRRRLVLVVDDDAAQRDLMTRYLQRAGFHVRTAADGEAGLRMARELMPDAILLDVLMPKMDGWEVLGRLKHEPALADIPVILASFVDEPALGRALGATDYLLKPVDRARLAAVMSRIGDTEGDILVVDDDPDVRTRLRTALQRGGWSVVEAANGQEALQRVTAAKPQVILLDLTMPVMDGFAFLHALRARPDGAAIPVVVLSARDLDDTDRRNLDGATEILRKDEISIRDLPTHLRDVAQ